MLIERIAIKGGDVRIIEKAFKETIDTKLERLGLKKKTIKFNPYEIDINESKKLAEIDIQFF
jgi:hypothetical protein